MNKKQKNLISEDVLLERIETSERLFQDFKKVTSYPFEPIIKSFDSFEDYEKWKDEQTNPWYR